MEQSFFQARYLDGEWLHATSSAYYYNIDIVISCLKLFEYIYSYTNPEIKPEWLDGFSMKSIKDYCRNSQGDAGKNIRAGYLVECLKNNNIDEYILNSLKSGRNLWILNKLILQPPQPYAQVLNEHILES
mgnify:CR=1 FL=1